MPLSQIKARDFIRDFVRVRGLRKKHAHKAPEKKQQQESGLIGLLLLFFGRCAWDFIETPSGLDISKPRYVLPLRERRLTTKILLLEEEDQDSNG